MDPKAVSQPGAGDQRSVVSNALLESSQCVSTTAVCMQASRRWSQPTLSFRSLNKSVRCCCHCCTCKPHYTTLYSAELLHNMHRDKLFETEISCKQVMQNTSLFWIHQFCTATVPQCTESYHTPFTTAYIIKTLFTVQSTILLDR